MSRSFIMLTLLAASFACASGAVDVEPADPRTALEFFVGAWTVKGSEATYVERCEWLTRSSFVVCTGTDTDPNDPGRSLSIFGYSRERQVFTYSGFSSGGSGREMQGWHVDGSWMFVGGSDKPPLLRRWQVTMVPTPDGFRFVQETSTNGAPWEKSVDIEYVRTTEKKSRGP